MHVGHIIAALAVVVPAALLGFRYLEWRRRWALRIGGTPVRLEDVTLMREARLELELIGDVARAAADVLMRPELAEFRVIVRPQLLNATWDTERAFPVTPRVFVAIVPPHSPGRFVAHELARHIFPFRLFSDSDPDHLRADMATVEASMKFLLSVCVGADVDAATETPCFARGLQE